MKGMYIFLIVILSILFLSLGSFLTYIVVRGGFSMGPIDRVESNIRKEEKVSIDNIKDLSVKLISSNIYVREATDNNIRLVQYSNNRLEDRDLFRMNKSSDSINFEADRKRFVLFGFYPSSVFELYIPKDYCENLNIEGISSKIVFENDICAKKTVVNTTSGTIEGKSFSGDIEIRSVSGRIQVNKISGKSNLRTTSGRIEFINLENDTNIKSVSGSVKGENIVGIANVETTSGRIEVENFQVKGNSNFKTVSGSVNLGIFDSNCEIKAKSTSGKIVLPNDSAVIGTSPYFDVFIKTTSGGIRIEQK